MKKPYKQPVKKLTKKEWAKIDAEYSEDMKTQIAANNQDPENFVNVVFKGVTIPLTKEDMVAWEKLSRQDKRAVADSVKKKIQSGDYEYIRYEKIKLIRPKKHEGEN